MTDRPWWAQSMATERAADPDADGAVLAPVKAKVILAAVFCGFGTVAMAYVIDSAPGPGEIVLATVCLSALLALQFFGLGATRPPRPAPAYAILAAQAVLAYLPLPLMGQGWVSQPSFLAGGVLLVLPPRLRWVVFAAIVAGTGVAQYAVDASVHSTLYILTNTATTGLYVYGLTRLGRLVAALHLARHEQARRAVADERQRFDQDLQDLLGTSLSTIAPHGEIALRLLPSDPDGAARELQGIQTIGRRALADARALAQVYRAPDESESLVALLAASRVTLRTELDPAALPPEARAGVAAVLRLAIRQVLRRPDLARCDIVLRSAGEAASVEIHAYEPGVDLDRVAAAVAGSGSDVTVLENPDGSAVLRMSVPRAIQREVGPPRQADEESMSRSFATGLVAAVVIGLAAQAVLRLSWYPAPPLANAAAAAMLAGACVLQLGLLGRSAALWRPPASYGLLLGLAVLLYGPWAVVEVYWVGQIGLLAGSALLLLRPVPAWTVFALVVASVAWTQIGSPAAAPRAIGSVIIIINTALVVYGLMWMARSARQLGAARRTLAAAALTEARARFARDLHDVLGLSLSAIAMKSDLALRLLAKDPQRAGPVLVEMVEVSRSALATVRAVAGGHHRTSLDAECRTAEGLLRAAGLETEVHLDSAAIPPEVATELAMVLREGITNVLRHSAGTYCEVTVSASDAVAALHIVNDGAGETANTDGTGLHNMAERVVALGGALTARGVGAGRFELTASVPLDGHATNSQCRSGTNPIDAM